MKKIMMSGISLAALCVVAVACAPEETFRSTGMPSNFGASPLPGNPPNGLDQQPGSLPSSTISSVPSAPVPPREPGSNGETPVVTGTEPVPAPVAVPVQVNPAPSQAVPRVIVKEDELVIKDEVLFVFDGSELTHFAEILLDEVAKTIQAEKGKFRQIQVLGHTDQVGDADYNLKLSRARAKAVCRYLIRVKKIDANLLSFDGFGASRLKDRSNPESEVNRRVEFKIVR
ncbi:MAG: OmpA family protein [Methylotenera sp.]|nr:OmpA family protein [Oligoflexia bacterium]